MPYTAPAPTTDRGARLRPIRLLGIVAFAAVAIAAGREMSALAPVAATTTATVSGQRSHAAPVAAEPAPAAPAAPAPRPAAAPLAKSEGLDPALLAALRRAAGDAAADGVDLIVNSGWRSPDHQARLLREAIERYGSVAEARRWVATPTTSPHVSGDAVDIGPADSASWLARHGATYGLCQIYGNEPWHFELRPEAAAAGCPATYPDPTHDPRMQP